MRKLIIDQGNTQTKTALFEQGIAVEVLHFSKNVDSELERLVNAYAPIDSAIWSSVKSDNDTLTVLLKNAGIPIVIALRSGLLLPLKITYKTPDTLGSDRLANACGAWSRFPGANCLVIDLGTCIKYDFVSTSAIYQGGSISPGMRMRYKALKHYTGKLPLIEPAQDEFPELIGQSTQGAIRSGVELGILAELDGIIHHYQKMHNDLKIILTGGDYARFADKLKSPIFAAPNLTLEGLRVILDHNDHL